MRTNRKVVYGNSLLQAACIGRNCSCPFCDSRKAERWTNKVGGNKAYVGKFAVAGLV